MPPPDDQPLASFAAGLLEIGAHPPAVLAPLPRFPAGHGYAVHRNGALTGLCRALAEIFPTLRRLIGAENFTGLATLYARAHPPRTPVLQDYGRDFADFIECRAEVAHLPFLGDVARVERLWLDSWHAADAPPLPAEALAGIEPDRLMSVRFTAHPAAGMVTLRHAAASLVRIDRAGGDLGGFDPGRPETALITRPEVAVHITPLDPAPAAFFTAVLSGDTLMDAASQALQTAPDTDLSALVAVLIDSGAVTALA